ncbi:hypothetical protein U1769_19960 [Sphingomonas sp. ZT3P38]|uniref:hypothetical protein n=1 Tax=Parasphingomonas zepuensis TaxID=3096161 RepID=UPI002FC76E86
MPADRHRRELALRDGAQTDAPVSFRDCVRPAYGVFSNSTDREPKKWRGEREDEDEHMTMLMRIAQGIHASLSGKPSIEADIAWETMSVSERAQYVTAAVRMLTILRSPTDQMLADGNRRDLPQDAANIWERMAYRALHES